MKNEELPVKVAEKVLVPVLPLSPTELTVFRLLIGGLTENQVATSMQRSPNTVHVHVRNIYRKLGVGKRSDLISLYEQHGEALVDRRSVSTDRDVLA